MLPPARTGRRQHPEKYLQSSFIDILQLFIRQFFVIKQAEKLTHLIIHIKIQILWIKQAGKPPYPNDAVGCRRTIHPAKRRIGRSVDLPLLHSF